MLCACIDIGSNTTRLLVAEVRDGRVVQAGAPGEVYLDPADLAVGGFLGEAVVLEAERDGAGARTALGPLAVRGAPGAGPGRVLLRPEQLRLVAPGSGVPARVAGRTFHGHDALLVLELAGGVRVRARSWGHEAPEVDARVGVAVTGDVAFYRDGP